MADDTPFDPPFDPQELAAAERLDREIDDILAGRPAARTDPVALWLATSLRSTPPPTLRRRIAAEVRGARERRPLWREWLTPPGWPRLAALALALVLLGHGISNQLVSEWVARGLGEPHSPHAYIEGGWALIAVAIAVGAGALHRRWLPVSVGAGVPLGIALGAGGIAEIGVFAPGVVLHGLEGLLAIVLFVTWFLRYGRRRPPEERA